MVPHRVLAEQAIRSGRGAPKPVGGRSGWVPHRVLAEQATCSGRGRQMPVGGKEQHATVSCSYCEEMLKRKSHEEPKFRGGYCERMLGPRSHEEPNFKGSYSEKGHRRDGAGGG